MTQQKNPYRPLTPYEVEQKKSDLLDEYRHGRSGLVATGKMFSQSLEYTPDVAKYNMGTCPIKLSDVEGDFELHKWQTILQEKKGREARPLGNLLPGHPSWTDMHVSKDVLDTSIDGNTGYGGGVLVRTDLVPSLYLWLNTRFPALERIQRIPANGVEHTWNNEIDFGDANDDFIDEFGCPVISHGTYFRGRTNIAIIAIERGVSLKLQYAVQQSGMTYNGNQTTADIEMQNAVLSRAKLLQKAFYYGTTQLRTDNAAFDGHLEMGKSFVNGFNGLRVLISEQANSVHNGFYPTGFGPVIGEATPSTTTPAITKAIDAVAGRILDNGGMPTAIHMSVQAEQALRDEGINLVRYTMDELTVGGGMVLGGRVRAIDTVAGLLPVVIVPGHGIGRYQMGSGTGTNVLPAAQTTGHSAGDWVEDIYVLSEPYLQMPYLGSPDPVPIEIPLGLPSPDGTGCLTRRFMLWWMIGLAMPIPIFQGKVRIPSTAPSGSDADA